MEMNIPKNQYMIHPLHWRIPLHKNARYTILVRETPSEQGIHMLWYHAHCTNYQPCPQTMTYKIAGWRKLPSFTHTSAKSLPCHMESPVLARMSSSQPVDHFNLFPRWLTPVRLTSLHNSSQTSGYCSFLSLTQEILPRRDYKEKGYYNIDNLEYALDYFLSKSSITMELY